MHKAVSCKLLALSLMVGLVMGATRDYYMAGDGVGNDANDASTSELPVLTFVRVQSLENTGFPTAYGDTVNVHMAAGTYTLSGYQSLNAYAQGRTWIFNVDRTAVTVTAVAAGSGCLDMRRTTVSGVAPNHWQFRDITFASSINGGSCSGGGNTNTATTRGDHTYTFDGCTISNAHATGHGLYFTDPTANTVYLVDTTCTAVGGNAFYMSGNGTAVLSGGNTFTNTGAAHTVYIGNYVTLRMTGVNTVNNASTGATYKGMLISGNAPGPSVYIDGAVFNQTGGPTYGSSALDISGPTQGAIVRNVTVSTAGSGGITGGYSAKNLLIEDCTVTIDAPVNTVFDGTWAEDDVIRLMMIRPTGAGLVTYTVLAEDIDGDGSTDATLNAIAQKVVTTWNASADPLVSLVTATYDGATTVGKIHLSSDDDANWYYNKSITTAAGTATETYNGACITTSSPGCIIRNCTTRCLDGYAWEGITVTGLNQTVEGCDISGNRFGINSRAVAPFNTEHLITGNTVFSGQGAVLTESSSKGNTIRGNSLVAFGWPANDCGAMISTRTSFRTARGNRVYNNIMEARTLPTVPEGYTGYSYCWADESEDGPLQNYLDYNVYWTVRDAKINNFGNITTPDTIAAVRNRWASGSAVMLFGTWAENDIIRFTAKRGTAESAVSYTVVAGDVTGAGNNFATYDALAAKLTTAINDSEDAQFSALTVTDNSAAIAGQAISVTVANATDTITAGAAHQFKYSDLVILGGTTVPTGATFGALYYVTHLTATGFQISTTDSFTALNMTGDGAAVVVYPMDQPPILTIQTNDGLAIEVGVPTAMSAAGKIWLTQGRWAKNDVNSVFDNPGFMNPAAGDFRVGTRSPAIRAASDGGTIGSWQYQGYDPHWIDGPPRDR